MTYTLHGQWTLIALQYLNVDDIECI